MLFSNDPGLVKEAQYWFEQARESGSHPFATYALGVILITGKTNTILNPNSEDKWYKEKVRNGQCIALIRLSQKTCIILTWIT